MWNFTRLPEEEWQNFEKLYNERNFVELVKIHNKYRLSEYTYCCSAEIDYFFKWVEYGIRERNEIKGNKNAYGKDGHT